MQAKTQQRLVGLLILLAVLLIFLPVLFHTPYPSLELQTSSSQRTEDKSKNTDVRKNKNIQKEQSMMREKVIHNKWSKEPEELEKRVSLEETSKNEVSHSSLQKEIPFFMTIPKAWCLQVRPLQKTAAAHSLLLKLRRLGYDVFAHDQIDSQGIHFIEIFIGPEVCKESLFKIKEKLWKENHLQSVIRPYKVRM